MKLPPILRLLVHLAVWGFCLCTDLIGSNINYSWVVVTGAGDQGGLKLDFINERHFVRCFRFLLCQYFPFLIKLLKRFENIIAPRGRPLIFLITFDDLINICQFISNISLHFFLFGPLHLGLISTRSRAELMQFSLIINEISSFCLMLPWLLTLFSFSILSLLDLVQRITVNFSHLVAWNAITRGWADRVIKFSNTNSACHLINSTLILTYFYFYYYFNFFIYYLRSFAIYLESVSKITDESK